MDFCASLFRRGGTRASSLEGGRGGCDPHGVVDLKEIETPANGVRVPLVFWGEVLVGNQSEEKGRAENGGRS